MKITYVLAIGAATLALSACTQNQVDRLRAVGQEPPLEKMNANASAASEPISWPQTNFNSRATTSNSLWSQGSKDFFRDQRARHVGDILTVRVTVDDSATLDNKSQSKRDSSESLGVPGLFGFEKNLADAVLPDAADTSKLLSVKGSGDHSGEGTIERGEKVETSLAAVVTQVMDNGNLVIYGSQEIRVNYEVRQLTVQGVIRPEDIETNNIIDSSRIAEARVSYGGKGMISEVQQPRVGHQIVDILSPF